MKLGPYKFLLAFVLFCSCDYSEKDIILDTQKWIHGSENCEENSDPAIQIVQYNDDTWILRQNKCTNYEAPFMFLFLGEKKALLMDTGATADENIFPLYKTVKKIISAGPNKNKDLELIVAHTHKHGDHYAADAQFDGKPNTSLIGLEVADIKAFFKISNWPDQIVDFDLGNRKMIIIPIPGHEASSIAIYDPSTKILLTGDSLYPGRLYVKNWAAYKRSIERLVEFTDTNNISAILGNHIEMSRKPGIDYPIQTIYQPEEHQLPLNIKHLKELSNALTKLGDQPQMEIHDSFIIYPID
ncbi:MBL fold metallo-hydrolase [Eudoraea chungangensis]|uniref:MBL fold metallo-hydrolase n=1 Tax=Eudoraea chungangensis TaxID=1481905 RepID=UPI0023EAE2C0|nr:MBL fold metallo-hydrolase [Eudoraea chungangensis]